LNYQQRIGGPSTILQRGAGQAADCSDARSSAPEARDAEGADRLRELNYSLKPFNASKRATTEARQFTYANLRAEAHARMRDKMIRGEVGLPYSPELEQELRAPWKRCPFS
jgi:hypothetical protein